MTHLAYSLLPPCTPCRVRYSLFTLLKSFSPLHFLKKILFLTLSLFRYMMIFALCTLRTVSSTFLLMKPFSQQALFFHACPLPPSLPTFPPCPVCVCGERERQKERQTTDTWLTKCKKCCLYGHVWECIYWNLGNFLMVIPLRK